MTNRIEVTRIETPPAYAERYPDEDQIYFFTDNQQPPRYAVVTAIEHNGAHVMSGGGPMSPEEFSLAYQQVPPEAGTAENSARMAQMRRLREDRPYEIQGLDNDSLLLDGAYPGGVEHSALNMARWILGGGAPIDD